MTRPYPVFVLYSLTAAASLAFASEPSPSTSTAALTGGETTLTATTNAARTYKAVKGDSFTSVSEKFGCSIRALKKLNGIKSTHLKPGTELEIPASKIATKHGSKKSPSVATTSPARKPVVLSAKDRHRLALDEALRATDKYSHRHAPVAQPVQDFDAPPAFFASCPTPPSNGTETSFAAASDDGVKQIAPPAPQAEATEPQPLATQNPRAGLLPVPVTAPSSTPAVASTSSFTANRAATTAATFPAASKSTAGSPLTAPVTPKKSFANALADFFGGNAHGMSASESGEWGNRFLAETRNLAAQGICYDGSWRPEGESHRWAMDCSNTSRYLYQVTAGIQLPRTASDQYYYLHLQDKAWDVPMAANGFADCNFLRSNLKPGDLLFWENTYRPERQPPITHVMIFLGSDARGRWLMAGSQGSKGMYNRRHSGPDVYVFDPTHAVGGYTTWLGLVRHHGQFVAYGRPLEADVKKLSVAAND